ncbi:MAG: DEAD/DEAH box helicase [Bacteroidota bacterium]
MNFKDLNLDEHIISSLQALGYETPSPIQQKAIPYLLEGRDVFGCAQTGTGKTAAFALPILQLLHRNTVHRKGIKALILAPTRELAIQIGESFTDYGKGLKIKHTVIFGGVSQLNQTQALGRGVDVLIATPGRLLDLMNQGFIRLDTIEFFVLDEADRMLDMGFIHDIKKIIPKLPKKRQTMFLSATVPEEIRSLANSLLTDPVRVEVTPVSSPVEMIKQRVLYVEKSEKKTALHSLITEEKIEHALIFTRTKHGADKVAKELSRQGIKAEAIHGNKSQNARQRALAGFKDRTVKILVATDIASRGIDVDKLSHVINFELPEVPETYIHRIGRTGRAGEAGIAISLCSTEELTYLRDINKLVKNVIDEMNAPPVVSRSSSPAPAAKSNQRSSARPPQRRFARR